LGGVITFILGITENNFSNLWMLVLITNVSSCLPLFAISLIDNTDSETKEEKNGKGSERAEDTTNGEEIVEENDLTKEHVELSILIDK
jgi:hypothetical protein